MIIIPKERKIYMVNKALYFSSSLKASEWCVEGHSLDLEQMQIFFFVPCIFTQTEYSMLKLKIDFLSVLILSPYLTLLTLLNIVSLEKYAKVYRISVYTAMGSTPIMDSFLWHTCDKLNAVNYLLKLVCCSFVRVSHQICNRQTNTFNLETTSS